MKKLTTYFSAITMIALCFAFTAPNTATAQVCQDTDQQNIHLSVEVLPYIEVQTEDLSLELTDICPAQPGADDPVPNLTSLGDWADNAYSNTALTINVTGNNDASDGYPIFARQETGSLANGYDRLITRLRLYFEVNGISEYVEFLSDAGGANTGTWPSGSGSVKFNQAPHDGEINFSLLAGASLPHTTPEFGVDNSWNQSADAGEYECDLTVTYSAGV